jgi:hypothetical protein
MSLNVFPNIVKKKRERSEKEGITVFFSFSLCLVGLLLHHAMSTKTIRNRKLQRQKKKHKKAEKNPSFLRLDFLSFATYYFLPIIMKQ